MSPLSFKVQVLYTFYKVVTFFSQHRSLASFIVVLLGILVADVGFHHSLVAEDGSILGVQPSTKVDMSFAPEVWLSILALTLGTLIIIISIAAQDIPKLIDLYMEDWISLFFIWFLILAAAHAVFVKFYNETWSIRLSSVILNIHFFLPLAVVFSLPYIFYILKSTQPSDVIKKIFYSQLQQIHSFRSRYIQKLLTLPSFIQEVQHRLFKSLSQLDNFLEYAPFREAKAQIIQDMSVLVQEYIRVKPCLNPHFFKVSPQVREDISFRTLMGQFAEIERTYSFYEQKCFRLMGNTYIKLIEDKEFDLASLCGLEITRIGYVALAESDDLLLSVIIIRFNTMLRFALKHGVKNNEARNLYNLVFHYKNFIKALVEYDKIEPAKQSFYYLRIYGTEIFRHGRISPSMYFIVDVFAAEMKDILITAHQRNWPLEVQLELLNEMLQIDSPPDFTEGDLDRGQLLNNGVRILQIGLGLYYLGQDRLDLAQRIIADILEDLEYLGESAFRRTIELTCHRLKLSAPQFWEDTDRGNLNLYYTDDLDQIDQFKAVLYEQMRYHLLIMKALPERQLNRHDSRYAWGEEG